MPQPLGHLFDIDTVHQQVGCMVVSEAMEGEAFRYLRTLRDELVYLHACRHVCHMSPMMNPELCSLIRPRGQLKDSPKNLWLYIDSPMG